MNQKNNSETNQLTSIRSKLEGLKTNDAIVDNFNDEQKKVFNELDRNGKRQLLKSLKGKKKYGFK
jgi:hypothetical protein